MAKSHYAALLKQIEQPTNEWSHKQIDMTATQLFTVVVI